MKKYRADLDCIKGICIIAVFLFHYGILRSGYLGVDVFFVINGFLVVPTLVNRISEGAFSYKNFLQKRILRLFPLVLLLSSVSLILGYFFMLPFEYERLSRSVVSSILLSENLRSAFTFGDYWEILNDYSPMFHLWYVGILFEFYVIFPFILVLARLVSGKHAWSIRKTLIIVTIALFGSSLLAYLIVPIDPSYKFYLLPFRLFEILAGGLIAVVPSTIMASLKPKVQNISFFGLMAVVFISVLFAFQNGLGHQVRPIAAYDIGLTTEGLPVSPILLLLLIVVFACFVVAKENKNYFITNPFLVFIGKRCYSIFIWHQFVLAFYRNSISDEISVKSFVVCLACTMIIAELSYRYVERITKWNAKRIIAFALIAIVVLPTSIYIYKNGGVVRDYPELDLKWNEGYVGVAVSYVDEPREDDHDFPDKDNGKKNVLVVGNSFARDFSNILKQTEYVSKLNFSYSQYGYPIERVSKADYIFTFLTKETLSDSILKYVKPTCKIYGIGTKNFGKSNNQFYSHRWSMDYFNSTTVLPSEYERANDVAKEHWGNAYIDLIEPAMVDSLRVRVFTPEHKYISQDCKHLTKAGAKWYASVLDLKSIFYNL